MLKGAAKLQVCTHLLDNALNGFLILGTPLPNSRGPRPTLLYTAAPPGGGGGGGGGGGR
jgi:hypothetical protein